MTNKTTHKYFQIKIMISDNNEVDEYDELIDTEYTLTKVLKIQDHNKKLVLKEINEFLDLFI
jgi:hypothetical protein